VVTESIYQNKDIVHIDNIKYLSQQIYIQTVRIKLVHSLTYLTVK